MKVMRKNYYAQETLIKVLTEAMIFGLELDE